MSCSAALGLVLVLVLSGAACAVETVEAPPREAAGAPAPVVSAELVELEAFQELTPPDDPFAALVPERSPCPAPAYVIEDDLAGFSTLEVRTDVCNYLTLVQPSRAPIRRGDTLQLLMWHNTLDSLESAQAYAAIRIGDRTVWSVNVPIPSAAASFTPQWQAEDDLPPGVDVVFHIHNHGKNAWRLGGLTVETMR